MPEINLPHDMLKVQPDIGTIFADLNAAGVDGPMKAYCSARINGDVIVPELAKAAYDDAEKLINAGESANSMDVQIGAGKTIALDVLKALCEDIKRYAKFAASKQEMMKLANKFASIIK